MSSAEMHLGTWQAIFLGEQNAANAEHPVVGQVVTSDGVHKARCLPTRSKAEKERVRIVSHRMTSYNNWPTHIGNEMIENNISYL